MKVFYDSWFFQGDSAEVFLKLIDGTSVEAALQHFINEYRGSLEPSHGVAGWGVGDTLHRLTYKGENWVVSVSPGRNLYVAFAKEKPLKKNPPGYGEYRIKLYDHYGQFFTWGVEVDSEFDGRPLRLGGDCKRHKTAKAAERAARRGVAVDQARWDAKQEAAEAKQKEGVVDALKQNPPDRFGKPGHFLHGLHDRMMAERKRHHPAGRLLASSTTEDGILKMINEHFYSTTFRLIPMFGGFEGIWRIANQKGDVDGYRVYLKKGRYRFERIDEPTRHESTPKDNPPGVEIYHNLIEIRAEKSDGRLYKHSFGKGAKVIGMADGSLKIVSTKGKRLWKNFTTDGKGNR